MHLQFHVAHHLHTPLSSLSIIIYTDKSGLIRNGMAWHEQRNAACEKLGKCIENGLFQNVRRESMFRFNACVAAGAATASPINRTVLDLYRDMALHMHRRFPLFLPSSSSIQGSRRIAKTKYCNSIIL